MSRKPEIIEPDHQTCLYDTLLETFLPVIHKAASSVCSGTKNGASGDLLLAGLKGLKEAFLQTHDSSDAVSSDIVTNRIYASMHQQILLNTMN